MRPCCSLPTTSADPCADRVVCALQLAVSSRAQRMGDLLSALADSTRDEVALRLRIETSRASIRSGVRTVLVVSVAFAAALAVLSHPYLQPFDSANGQVVLLVVGAMYGLGLTLMVSMARPPAPVRLLGRPGDDSMTSSLILGALVGLGLLGVVYGLRVAPASLESIVGGDEPTGSIRARPGGAVPDFRARTGRRLDVWAETHRIDVKPEVAGLTALVGHHRRVPRRVGGEGCGGGRSRTARPAALVDGSGGGGGHRGTDGRRSCWCWWRCR